MTTPHTTYSQASAGYEREFEHKLVEEITLAIGHLSTYVLAATLAMPPPAAPASTPRDVGLRHEARKENL